MLDILTTIYAIALAPLLKLIQDHPASAIGIVLFAALQPILGLVAEKAYDGIKTILPFFDRAPALVHQVAAPIFGFLFGLLSNATGAAALTGIESITPGFIGGLLTTLVMAGVKRWEKSKAPVDATLALAVSRRSTGTTPGAGV